MPGGAYSVYAADTAEGINGATLSFSSPQYNSTSAGSSNYMPVTAALGMNLAGVLVYFQSIVTPNAATAQVTGNDILDLGLIGYEVTNQVGGGVRAKTISRLAAEEAERMFLAPSTDTSFVYPRSSVGSFTATTAAVTKNCLFFIPAAGGQACNVKIYWPGAAQAYSTSASITSILNTYYLYAVPTLSTARTAVMEVNSRTLGAGQQDIATDIPAGMAPDWLDIVNTTWGTSSTNISKVVIDAQNGAGRSVDYEDIYAGNAAQTLFPTSQAADQSNIIINMHRQRADHLWVTTGTSWSATLDELWLELDDGSPLVPEPAAAATTTTPLTQSVATTNASGAVVPRKVASGAPGGRKV